MNTLRQERVDKDVSVSVTRLEAIMSIDEMKDKIASTHFTLTFELGQEGIEEPRVSGKRKNELAKLLVKLVCVWNCELILDLTINRVFDLDEGGHGGETIKDFSSASRPPPWSNRSIRPRQSIRQSTDKREALYLTTEPKHDLQLLHRHGCCWLSVYRLSVRARSLKVQDLFGLLFLFSESLSILRVSQF